jgi:hypothetical protein
MDLMGRADIADYLGPGYRPSQALAEELIARDQITALRSPSAEFWPDVETNETYFVMVGAQPRREDFPDTQEDGWYVGGA